MLFSALGRPVWRTVSPSLLTREDAAAKGAVASKIAGFDLNDTLVSSKVGAPGYMVTISDWKCYNDDVVPKLRELHNAGYKLVIFTNQGQIKAAVEGKRAQTFKAYVDAFLKELAVPVLVLAATQKDTFRKPGAGMWEHLERKANGGMAVDRAASFYVGDAAGNPGEHSADDMNFAKAVGVQFTHASDYFGPPGGRGIISSSGVAASLVSALASTTECGLGWQLTHSAVARPAPPIVIVLVGAPGCGKSTFASQLGPPAPAGPRAGAKASGGGLAGKEACAWRRVCQDLLGNKDACLRAASESLRQGFSVVVDRTNFSKEQRAPWLALAQVSGASCHCLAFDVAAEECYRRVVARPAHEGGLQGPGASRMVVMRLASQLEPVGTEEGFSRVRLLRSASDSEQELQLYGQGVEQSGGSEPPSKVRRMEETNITEQVGVVCGSGMPAVKQLSAPARSDDAARRSGDVAPGLRGAVEESGPPSWARVRPEVAARIRCRGEAAQDAVVAVPGAHTEALPAATQAVAAAPAPIAAPADPSGHTTAMSSEQKVHALVAMGFSEDACRAALVATDGNANEAASHLLADRLI